MLEFNKKNIGFGLACLVLFVAIFSAGFLSGKAQVVCKVCKPETVDFSLFWDAYNKLHANFINPDALVDQKILYGAIAGMTKSLQDPYTSFFDPEQAKIFEQDLEGEFSGVGIEVAVKKDQLTIIAPLKDTPSERAGLKSGDQIIKIDGKNTADISTDEAVTMIRGKKGTSVTLTIFREGWKETKDFTIIRDTIKIPALTWELKDGNIAYIHIFQFDKSLSSEFKKAAYEILQSPAKKIVLDLRDDPGGYLEVCQEVAGWFLEQGQTITIEDFGKTKPQQLYKAQGTGSFAHYPIVILINQGSASASEILAGALHDNRGIQLIGQKSFGKGSVQQVINLQDNASFLKITIAKWLTPKGHSISEIGLPPDVKVDMAENDQVGTDKDAQLQKALEIIRLMQ